MSFADTLRIAHLVKHRVGHDCDNLSPEEKEIYAKLIEKKTEKLSEGGVTARLEPKRYGVNWRQALLEAKGRDYVQNLEAKARALTRQAKQKFEAEKPNWRTDKASNERKRLVIEGPPRADLLV